MIYLAILVYLVGYVWAYLLFKADMRHGNDGRWRVCDRTSTLLISLFSWIGVLAGLIIWLERNYDSEKPAKW